MPRLPHDVIRLIIQESHLGMLTIYKHISKDWYICAKRFATLEDTIQFVFGQGYVGLVDWIRITYPKHFDANYPNYCCIAAHNDQLDIIKELRKYPDQFSLWDCLHGAIKSGNTTVLDWIQSMDSVFKIAQDNNLFNYAWIHGQERSLKWLLNLPKPESESSQLNTKDYLDLVNQDSIERQYWFDHIIDACIFGLSRDDDRNWTDEEYEEIEKWCARLMIHDGARLKGVSIGFSCA